MGKNERAVIPNARRVNTLLKFRPVFSKRVEPDSPKIGAFRKALQGNGPSPWEMECGTEGWIVVCDRRQKQVDYFSEAIS